MAPSPLVILFLGLGRGANGRTSGKGLLRGGSKGRCIHPAQWRGFQMLLRDVLKRGGPDLHGKGPGMLHRHAFVNFLRGWAHNACVHNSAREDGRAKRWQLLCYEICINCIKHSVRNSAARPFLSVFIVHRQGDQDADGNGLLRRPRCRNAPSFCSDVPGVACGSPLSSTMLMGQGHSLGGPPTSALLPRCHRPCLESRHTSQGIQM